MTTERSEPASWQPLAPTSTCPILLWVEPIGACSALTLIDLELFNIIKMNSAVCESFLQFICLLLWLLNLSPQGKKRVSHRSSVSCFLKISQIIYFALSLSCGCGSRSLHNMRMLNRAHVSPRFPPYVWETQQRKGIKMSNFPLLVSEQSSLWILIAICRAVEPRVTVRGFMGSCHISLMAGERQSWMGTSLHQHDAGKIAAVTDSIFCPSCLNRKKGSTGALGCCSHGL